MRKKRFNVLGVCNGQGVGLFPFKDDPKFNILGNLELRGEYFSPKNEQWAANFSGIPLFRSLEYCKQHLEDKKVHIIIGNPKCGGSSILRLSRSKQFKLLEKVSDEKTLDVFVKSVHEFKPHVFLLENLPQLLKLIPKESWKKEIFPGYELIFHDTSVANFGNSQVSRSRLVMIGVKKSSLLWEVENFLYIQPIHELKKTRALLRNLPDNGNVIEDDNKTLAMFHPNDPDKKKLTIGQIRELWITEFQDRWKWPWVNSKGSSGTLPGVYRNKPLGYPMTARKADRQFKWNGNPMSPRELARVMGIPDNFIIHIEMEKKGYWINKGRLIVTQTFPYEVGLWFKKCLLG